MRLYIASDHAGFPLKKHFVENLKKVSSLSIEWIDLGPADTSSVDYPSYAAKLCEQVLKTNSEEQLKEPCGVLICGSGVGVSMMANRFKKIRAVLAEAPELAAMSREHNASNVLCLGARRVSNEKAADILQQWLVTKFEGGRHERRIHLCDLPRDENQK